MPISIVILSHNRLGELSTNLPRLLSESHCPDEFKVIVVDNNSTDGSRDFLVELRKKYPEIVLVLNVKNLGVGGGRNSGFAVAQRDYIVALDDDTRIAVEDLRRIPGLFEKYGRAGILAFRVVHTISGEPQNSHGAIPCEVANHHGAGFAFRRCLYAVLGGIDEECDYGAEELDFAIRVHALGWEILYIPELTVYHNSLERNPATEQHRRIRRIYNNIRVYHKYFPTRMAARNSFRYLIVAVRSWLAIYGFSGVGKLLGAGMNGRSAGLSQRQRVPDDTVAFYDDPLLRPEFGNVSLLTKMKNRFGFRW